jgi:hypothetical protein
MVVPGRAAGFVALAAMGMLEFLEFKRFETNQQNTNKMENLLVGNS